MTQKDALQIVLKLARRGAVAPTIDVAAKGSEQHRREQEAIRIVEELANADASGGSPIVIYCLRPTLLCLPELRDTSRGNFSGGWGTYGTLLTS